MNVSERVVERLKNVLAQLGRELAAEGVRLEDGSYAVTIEGGTVVMAQTPEALTSSHSAINLTSQPTLQHGEGEQDTARGFTLRWGVAADDVEVDAEEG